VSGGEIRLVSLAKSYGQMQAVDAIDLLIEGGEFFSLLGSSGSGKTTTLRMIAGFEAPSGGQILLDGKDITLMPPHRRPVNTVFQNYALFPHLNVFDNVAFGLRRSKIAEAEVKKRVRDMLDLVQLAALAKRKPAQMSGGQQQRVALARALVLHPSVLLLDEPLGALDARLRKQLQIELKALQQKVGITFVYVTHDQEEALTMSDRIAIMSQGRIEQIASPKEMYEAPATAFVAEFLGVSNLMAVTRLSPETAGEGGVVQLGDYRLRAEHGTGGKSDIKITIRPERVKLASIAETCDENCIPGEVERWVYLGNAVQIIVRLLTGHSVQVLVHNDGQAIPFPAGSQVQVRFPPEALRLCPAAPV
jgi:spermidine/putrescine transport system ATP-binding protein